MKWPGYYQQLVSFMCIGTEIPLLNRTEVLINISNLIVHRLCDHTAHIIVGKVVARGGMLLEQLSLVNVASLCHVVKNVIGEVTVVEFVFVIVCVFAVVVWLLC